MAACGSAPAGRSPSVFPATTGATASPGPSASGDVTGPFDVGGYSLYLTCRGEGSPTVILEAGLGGRSSAWNSVEADVASTARVCSYDRAGLGGSESRPAGVGPASGLTPGFLADEEAKLLGKARIRGPYVAVGHSFGGMIARVFAARHPADVVGIVLVDSSSPRQFEPEDGKDPDPWSDGSSPVDLAGSRTELDAVTTLGAIPMIVLTQGDLGGAFERQWSKYQDQLATLSSSSLHMVANDSGHAIMDDQPALVVDSIRAVVESARSGASLPACEPTFAAVGAGCLATTMTARLDEWEAMRARVLPVAGPFPEGSFLETLTNADVIAATGEGAGFGVAKNTWVFRGGHWTVDVVIDDAYHENHEGTYAASGDELTLLIPLNWKSPTTPGINQLRWKADADGTIHFEQLDAWRREPDFTVPFVRLVAAG